MAGTINIIAGTTYSDTITIYESDGTTPRDLTGYNVKFKIAKTTGISDASATYFAQTDDATDFVITTAASGLCTITVPDTTSKDFTGGNYKWQIRLVSGAGVVTDTDQGECTITESLMDDE